MVLRQKKYHIRHVIRLENHGLEPDEGLREGLGVHEDISERVIVPLMPVGLLFESGPVFKEPLTQTSIHHKRGSRILQLIDHTAPLH
jgi:hypothetical protein